MESLPLWLNETLGFSYPLQWKLLMSALGLLLVWALRKFALIAVTRNVEDPRSLYHWRKTINYISFALAVIVVGRVWFKGMHSISTFLGLFSAGLAIALKDPLANLVGWAYLIWWKPFEVGDRIQIGNHSGDVIDRQVMQFVLLETGNWVDADQSTGRILHIPNGLIFSESLANYSKGFPFIWEEIPVLVTFESDWKKAKQLLFDITSRTVADIAKKAKTEIQDASRKHLIFYRKLDPIVYTTVKDSGILLTIRYLTEHRQRRMHDEAVWEEILTVFSEHNDIDFAYPTTRFYDNRTEAKETVVKKSANQS